MPEEAPVPEAAAPQPAPEQEVLADASVEPPVPELALEPSAKTAPDADAPSDAEPIGGVPTAVAREEVAPDSAPIATPPPTPAPPAKPSVAEQPAEVPVTDPIEAPPIDADPLAAEACEGHRRPRPGTKTTAPPCATRSRRSTRARRVGEGRSSGSSRTDTTPFAGSTGPRAALETTTEGVRAVVLLPEGAEVR